MLGFVIITVNLDYAKLNPYYSIPTIICGEPATRVIDPDQTMLHDFRKPVTKRYWALGDLEKPRQRKAGLRVTTE